MKHTVHACAVLLLLFHTLSAHAADPAAGKSLYGTCVACHGAAGEGMLALNAPALAGQQGAYLLRQLEHFKSGLRGADPKDSLGMQMRGMAATLADATAVEDVVAYIGTLPVPATPAGPDYNKRNGENQYNAACGACHGGTAQGNPALNAPRLAGLDAAYLKRQYRNFGDGIRGSHKDDRYGRQMKMMATMLKTEQDLNDVIGYILAQ
ncbi:MAG: c-type cytochrome [Halieaceae bacterium]